MKRKALIAIVGATGSGKTALAIELAQKFNGEIVSADSRAVYRGLDVGTAKPTVADQRKVKHHLIDVAGVGRRFTVADFQRLAFDAIDAIHRCGKIPFLVGGTGLYIDAILYNYQFPPDADLATRHRLEQKSLTDLIALLQQTDPAAFRKVDIKNRRRVIRALEIAFSTNQSMAKPHRGQPKLDHMILGLTVPTDELRRRFDARLDNWLAHDFIDEIKHAIERSSQEWVESLGLQYRFFAQYLAGEIDLATAIEQTKKSNYQFIKRQLTWFKRNKEINWIDSPDRADRLIIRFLS